jgi:hypothetical protein
MAESGDGNLHETPPTRRDIVRQWLTQARPLAVVGMLLFAGLHITLDALFLAHNNGLTFDALTGTRGESASNTILVVDILVWTTAAYLTYRWGWCWWVSE